MPGEEESWPSQYERPGQEEAGHEEPVEAGVCSGQGQGEQDRGQRGQATLGPTYGASCRRYNS